MNIFLYVTLLVKMNRVNNNIKLCCVAVVVVGIVGVIAMRVYILGIGICAARCEANTHLNRFRRDVLHIE